MTSLKLVDTRLEGFSVHLRPWQRKKDELSISEMPKKKVRQAILSPCPYEKIDRR